MKSMGQNKIKLLSVVLTFAMVLSIFSIIPLTASAAVGDEFTDGAFTFTVTENNTVQLTGFDNSINDVVIPETVNNNGVDYTVTSILGNINVFFKNSEIDSVTIPGTIKTLDNSTFAQCPFLERVTIQEGVETISTQAFYNCTSLKSITLPTSVKTIGISSFSKCTSLKDFYINSDAEIMSRVFVGSTALENVYCNSANITFATAAIPAATTLSSDFKMYGYAGSTAETYANSRGYTFVVLQEDEPTTEVTEPSTEVTEPSTGATEPGTTEVTEPTTEPDTSIFKWETINDGTAVKITGIKDEYKTQTDIEIPAEINGLPVTTIGASAFMRGKAVNVTLPASVTAIEDKAFYYSSIETLTFAENSQLQTIGVSAFEESSLANVTIPASVTTIGNRAFYKTWIITLAFEENSQLQTIGESAFESSMVKYVTIPASVTTISDRAFYQCSNLTTLTFEENSQLEKIGNKAFYREGSDDKLNEVILPASLKQIGYRAFYNRANLVTVKVYSRDVVFGDSENGTEVFDLYTGTSSLKLYGYTGSTAEAYAAENNHTFRYLDLDTTELQALYDQAKAIDSSLYTEESYKVLSQAMIKADIMLHNSNATPTEVAECTANLQAAIDGLVEYAEPTTTEPETTEAPTTRPAEYIEYILGDADGEGYVDIKDATLIQKHLASLATITGKELLAADVDGDERIDIKDATYIQKWLASYEVEFAIGEVVRVEVTPTNPTDEPSTTEPATTEPEPSTETFYLPNYVSWLTDMGGKMWVYNDETDEFMLMEYDEDADCFFVELPSEWSVLSFYRTPYETTEEEFDINIPWDDETQSGIILNKWVELGSRGENNCFKITGDGEGLYTEYNPYEEPDYMRTIYFDNSQTKWSAVYIYGWSFGLSNEWVMMEPVGNDIWAYTFYENLPVDGVKGFLFVNSTSWPGATQTNDLATEEGKNLFVPIPGGTKLSGTWDVYNPEE